MKTLSEQAIEAALEARKQAEEASIRLREAALSIALSQLKAELPTLELQGDYLVLEGHKFKPLHCGYFVNPYSESYCLVSEDGQKSVWDLASFGEFLLWKTRQS